MGAIIIVVALKRFKYKRICNAQCPKRANVWFVQTAVICCNVQASNRAEWNMAG